MQYFAVFVIALAVTMALIPPLIQYSGKFGLMDRPNERKIHSAFIPRVGGIGMIVGMVIPVLLWASLDKEMISLLAGIGVLLVFGVLDDRGDLDYRLKFLGQLIAVLVVIVFGDIVIRVVPFFGMDPVSPWLSIPFTALVLIAVTNAINLADGLDGLAAGVTLLSLAGTAVLAYLSSSTDIMLVTLAVMGVVTGFLRFNTYPARIFMGDAGSQFLGFTVGVLLVIFTQKTNPALNPAIPLFLIGLPLFDTMFVVFKRISHGQSPFSPDKNHIHHQLLSLRFDHYEAVIIIYFVQALFVVGGILLRYQNDLLVVPLWLFLNIALALMLLGAGRFHWTVHSTANRSFIARWMKGNTSNYLGNISLYIISGGITLLLIVGPIISGGIDRDIGIVAGVLFLLLLLRLIYASLVRFISLRLILYVTAAFVVYILNEYATGNWLDPVIIEFFYFGIISGALVICAWSSKEDAFRVTPTDFLLIMFLIGLFFLPGMHIGDEDIIRLVIKLVIIFYAIEYLLRSKKERWNDITIVTLWALGVITLRGLIL